MKNGMHSLSLLCFSSLSNCYRLHRYTSTKVSGVHRWAPEFPQPVSRFINFISVTTVIPSMLPSEVPVCPEGTAGHPAPPFLALFSFSPSGVSPFRGSGCCCISVEALVRGSGGEWLLVAGEGWRWLPAGLRSAFCNLHSAPRDEIDIC